MRVHQDIPSHVQGVLFRHTLVAIPVADHWFLEGKLSVRDARMILRVEEKVSEWVAGLYF